MLQLAKIVSLAVFLLFAGSVVKAGDRVASKTETAPKIGAEAPEIHAKDAIWLNTDSPACLADVKGRPSVVVFSSVW
jgi:hypothetical protein